MVQINRFDRATKASNHVANMQTIYAWLIVVKAKQ